MIEEKDNREYITFEADSVDSLLSKIQSYSYNLSASKVMTDAEKMLGTQVDYKG